MQNFEKMIPFRLYTYMKKDIVIKNAVGHQF